MKKVFSSFLFANTGFLIGLASAFNIPGNFYPFNTSDSPDTLALSQDANMVAQDSWNVLYEQK
nr:MAG TPA: hypothetical protein [Caudoviricetes sp.]